MEPMKTWSKDWPIDFLYEKPKIGHCLTAWLVCLDDFENFASHFYL